MPPPRDSDLYLDNIIVRAGGVLFKVPREIFARSPVFGSMFELPQAGTPDGTSDERPLVLDIKADEFRLFVRAASCLVLGGIATLDIAEWKIVLKLTDMLDLDDLRMVAVEQLHPLLTAVHAADRLQLAYEFHLDAWIMPAVHDLVTRTALISEADINVLHPRHLARVLEAREANLHGASASLRPGLSDSTRLGALSAHARTVAERLFGCAFAQPLREPQVVDDVTAAMRAHGFMLGQ